MAIVLAALTYRSAYRVRLSFSTALAVGAFSAVKYDVVSLDAAGIDEDVLAAVVIPDSAESVDLAFAFPLVAEGRYRVIYTAIPATDTSTVTGSFDFECPGAEQHASSTVRLEDIETLLYGEDLVFDGTDFVEGADGDLAHQSGVQVVKGWAEDMVESEGLLWDVDYSPRVRNFVDGAIGALPSLRGELVKKLLRDPRISQANAVVLSQTAGNESEATIDIDCKLAGGDSFQTQKDIRVG